MRESRTYGSVRGALSNGRPYRDQRYPGAAISEYVPGVAALTRATLAVGHGMTAFAGKSSGRKSAE